MEVADCVRIWLRVKLVVSVAKFVSVIPLSAEVRLVTMFPRFVTVESRRFMAEPRVDRSDSTEFRAVSILAMAACAEDWRDTPPKDSPEDRFTALKVMVELAPAEAAEIWN
jgi:hypothetical protein